MFTTTRSRVIAASVAATAAAAAGAVLLFADTTPEGDFAAPEVTASAVAPMPVPAEPQTAQAAPREGLPEADVSEECAAALVDLRALMVEEQSGLLIVEDPEATERFNALRADLRAGDDCSAEELVAVDTTEIAPWMLYAVTVTADPSAAAEPTTEPSTGPTTAGSVEPSTAPTAP